MPVPTPLPPTSPRFAIRTKPGGAMDAMAAAAAAKSPPIFVPAQGPPSQPGTRREAPGQYHNRAAETDAVRRASTETRPVLSPRLSASPHMQGPNESPCSCAPDSPASRARALAIGLAAPAPSGGFFPLPDPSKTHPENTTVFIGGLPPSVGRTELGGLFEAFGEIIYINVPPGKGCGFVSFDTRQAAEWAIERMQGFWLRGAQLRLAWGRIQGDKPKAKSTASNASDLSSSIKADLPFFSKMLDLTGEQQVKLGLYLEFAGTGALGRLKDILGMDKADKAATTPATDATEGGSALGLALGVTTQDVETNTHRPRAESVAVADNGRSSLSRGVDRLVDSPPLSAPSLTATRSSRLPSIPGHAASYTLDTPSQPSHADSTSPKASDSPASVSVSLAPSYGLSSISDEAVFRAFHPTPADVQAQTQHLHRLGSGRTQAPQAGQRHHQHVHHGHHHEHGENCVTPMSLQRLAQMQERNERQPVSYTHSAFGGASNVSAAAGYEANQPIRAGVVPTGPAQTAYGGAAGAPYASFTPTDGVKQGPQWGTSGGQGGYYGGVDAHDAGFNACSASGLDMRMNTLSLDGLGPASRPAQQSRLQYGANLGCSQQSPGRLDVGASEWVPGHRWGAGNGGYGSSGW